MHKFVRALVVDKDGTTVKNVNRAVLNLPKDELLKVLNHKDTENRRSHIIVMCVQALLAKVEKQNPGEDALDLLAKNKGDQTITIFLQLPEDEQHVKSRVCEKLNWEDSGAATKLAAVVHSRVLTIADVVAAMQSTGYAWHSTDDAQTAKVLKAICDIIQSKNTNKKDSDKKVANPARYSGGVALIDATEDTEPDRVRIENNRIHLCNIKQTKIYAGLLPEEPHKTAPSTFENFVNKRIQKANKNLKDGLALMKDSAGEIASMAIENPDYQCSSALEKGIRGFEKSDCSTAKDYYMYYTGSTFRHAIANFELSSNSTAEEREGKIRAIFEPLRSAFHANGKAIKKKVLSKAKKGSKK